MSQFGVGPIIVVKKGVLGATCGITADFSLSIDFERGAESQARVFKAMSGLIEAYQEADRELARTIEVNFEPALNGAHDETTRPALRQFEPFLPVGIAGCGDFLLAGKGEVRRPSRIMGVPGMGRNR